MNLIATRFLLLSVRLLALGLLAFGVTPASALEGTIGIHDPSTVIQCDRNYYVFGTGRGISVLTSSNGFNWLRGGRVFDRIPDSVKSFVPKNEGQGVWAPDIIKLNGELMNQTANFHSGLPVL